MDNQHRKIAGYRDLSQEEIDLFNEGKALGEPLALYIDKLRGNPDVDQRWVSIGMTHLQQGLMALGRAVAQQGTF
jgi:hypothetical protein